MTKKKLRLTRPVGKDANLKLRGLLCVNEEDIRKRREGHFSEEERAAVPGDAWWQAHSQVPKSTQFEPTDEPKTIEDLTRALIEANQNFSIAASRFGDGYEITGNELAEAKAKLKAAEAALALFEEEERDD